MHILCWDEMWHKNTFSSFSLSLSKFDRIVIIIIFRGDLDMFLWDCLSYLQHKYSIMLIQLLSHTHVSVRPTAAVINDLSAANNYTFTEMILQSWYFIRERHVCVQLQMTSETRHKDMSLLKSPVCDIMSSSESKGNFIPKTKIIFPLNLLKQFLWFFVNFKDENSWLEIHLNN